MEKWNNNPVNSFDREFDGAQEKEMIFGARAVIETIKAGKEIEKLFIQEDLGKSELVAEVIEIAVRHRLPITRVPIYKLNKITRKNHQGVVAFVSPIHYAALSTVIATTFEKGKVPLILILDSITDVRNIGAIVRTAECAGVDGIVVPTKNTAQLNSDAMKTSSGALNLVPICREKILVNTITYLQECGLQVIACTEKTENTLYNLDFTIPTALILGSEEKGIASELLQKADKRVKLPLLGKIESLNVSVAAGIALYEVVRQRFI